MKPNSGGRPRKRGTQKQHTSQRIEVGDKQWLDREALARGITVPDLIHALVAAAQIPGTPANQVVVLSSQVVLLENNQEVLRRMAAKFRAIAAEAHSKNYQLAQRLRAHLGATMALPQNIRDSLPDRLIAQGKRVLHENTVPEEQMVVL